MFKNSWLFPAVQSIHIIGIALLVGTTVLVDLGVLGLGFRRETELTPWTRRGFAIMLITGPVLFLSDVSRYLSNPAFIAKMVFLAMALVFHFTVHRRQTRLAAVLSMILWTLVVIGGRAIADFDV